MLEALNCPNCGAPLTAPARAGQSATCSFCQTTFRVAASVTPEPDMGDLLLGADFSSPHLPGWEIINPDNTRAVSAPRTGLQGSFPASERVHYLLTSSGWFDDLDVSVTLRFTAGDPQYIRGGILARYINTSGGYIVFISAQSTFRLACYTTNDKQELEWVDIRDWTTHSALRAGLDQDNRIRLLCAGERLRIYFNGVLATAFSDSRFKHGQVRLALEPSNKTAVTGIFSDLQVREAVAR